MNAPHTPIFEWTGCINVGVHTGRYTLSVSEWWDALLWKWNAISAYVVCTVFQTLIEEQSDSIKNSALGAIKKAFYKFKLVNGIKKPVELVRVS